MNLKMLVSVFMFKTTLYFSCVGSKKKETAPDSQPAAAPWSGGFLSGNKRKVVGRPEPLWRPICEEEEEAQSPPSEDSKPCVSKLSQEDMSPPSPRTLKAIQAAMNDSSDEEKVVRDTKSGGMSPRTLLAIQQALTEEEDGAAEIPITRSPTKLQAKIHHPAPLVVISSSEDEPEPHHVKSLTNNAKVDFKRDPTGQSLHVRDSLLVSSSEDEMEEMTGQRNKALPFAALQQPNDRGMKSEEETEKGQLTGELERRESDHGFNTQNKDLVQPQICAQICGKPLSAETEVCPVLLEQSSKKSTEAAENRSGDVVEGSEESESEGTVSADTRLHPFSISSVGMY